MSGLTSAGFVAATTNDVQTAIEQDELATIDPALNLSPVQPLGQLNGIYASAASNVWGLVQAIYAAIDPDGAVGVQLDNLCALTGCTRLAASKTLVICTVNLNAGTYAAGSLTANVVGNPSYTFTNRDQIVSAGGSVTGTVWLATQTGPIAVNATTLTVITNPVTGFNSITNPTAGTIGTNVETDTALRLRRAALLVASGGCTIDSIRASLMNPTIVAGVISAKVLENNTMATDGNGQPAKSFQALIWDGPSPAASDAAIAQAIWNTKPSGIQAFGTTSHAAVDATGKSQTVFFTRVTQVPIYFVLTVLTNPLTFPSNGATLIQNAMAALQSVPNADGYVLAPGVSVYAMQFAAAVMSVVGVLSITTWGQDVNPAPPTNPASLASVTTITPFQLATVSPSNITVTVT